MEKEIILVAGLVFGDEGKGTIVDYLARTRGAKVVVRYNGGAQAGHNVVTPEGLHHTFSQFGSGTLIPGTETFLSRFMIINPLSMIREEEHLRELGIKDGFARMSIDVEALVTTPFQVTANRILQTSGNNKNSSCGVGVGQTAEDYEKYGNKALFAKNLKDQIVLKKKLAFLQELNRAKVRNLAAGIKDESILKQWNDWLQDQTAVDDLVKLYLHFATLVRIVDENHLRELTRKNHALIFEGAQGALLDKDFGFHPYITKTNTTFVNAAELLRNAEYNGRVTKLGVLRGYATRHGAGPFTAEDDSLQKYLQEPHNLENRWQGQFRVGWQDLQALRYAIKINSGVDGLAVTHMDQIAKLPEIKIRFNSIFIKFANVKEYLDFLQSKNGLNIPIKIVSSGPTWKEKTAT